MCKKILYNREIEVVKLGTKNFIARAELIRYLKSRTISAVNFIDIQKLSAQGQILAQTPLFCSTIPLGLWNFVVFIF